MAGIHAIRAASRNPWAAANLAVPGVTRNGLRRSEDARRDPDSSLLAQLDLLDRINLAAAVIDRQGRIVELNRRCDRILGSGLTRQRDRLVAKDRRSNELLRKAIRAVFSLHVVGARPDPECGVIAQEPEPPILFKALALGQSALEGEPPYGLLIFSSPHLLAVADAGLLSQAFNLTPAQARLARHLATGASLDAAAARLGIKRETARNHLKQIFCRTGTCRQGELVARLSAFWMAAQEEGCPSGMQSTSAA